MATVAELKVQADSLGIKYSSKVRKPELELMIAEALRPVRMSNAARHANYVDQNMRAMRTQCLTPRQSRRIRKHERRMMGRA